VTLAPASSGLFFMGIKMAKPITRAVLYARFSPRRDPASTETIAWQLEECRKWAATNKLTVIGERFDETLSGDDVDRPGLWQAVELSTSGVALVAYKGDRLARDVYLDEAIRRTVTAQGGVVQIVDGTPNGDDPTDVLIRQILAAVSAWERKIIAARTKAAMQRHQSTGRAMSKVPPYGYCEGPTIEVAGEGGKVIKRRMLKPDEAEQAILTRIITMHCEGVTYARIASTLNREKVPARGRRWKYDLIRRIIERAKKSANDSVRSTQEP